jgi:hypothetical protein
MVVKMTETNNPLRKYFRQPAVHLRLPSGGKFYPTGTIDLPPNGEIPILPMTAVDEITSRTPDALFNGSAVAAIIGSCVPAIKDPWSVTAVDLSALLTAVRLASYGHEMEITTVCPKCGESHEFNVDLRVVLDNIKMPHYETPLISGDLTIFFAPLTYRQINDISRVQYEDSKLMQSLSDADISEEEKISRLGEAFKRVTMLTIRSISTSIAAIKSQDAMVTEKRDLEEFLINAPKAVFDSIRDHVAELRTATELKALDMTCQSCSNQYKQEFTLDMSNFFVVAS